MTNEFRHWPTQSQVRSARGRPLLCLVLSGFSAFLLVSLAAFSADAPGKVEVPVALTPLPGSLDKVPVFNSNSPEVVQRPGILLSTFPPEGMASPEAHLNLPLSGRFDIFLHHINKSVDADNPQTLYVGILLKNSSDKAITVNTITGASYLSQPDAPFIKMDKCLDNDDGNVFAGPGDRVATDVLKGVRQEQFPEKVTIAPSQTIVFASLPIPVRELTPHLNGRTGLIRLQSDGPLYLATLADFGRDDSTSSKQGIERPPSTGDWLTLLNKGGLSGPRDKAATALSDPGPISYGRVAGVSLGSQWKGSLCSPGSDLLKIPEPGKFLSYPISTVRRGTFGTRQIQSAPIVVRYSDTAYEAHGNYGVEYDLKLPLVNDSKTTRLVSIMLQSPLKTDLSSPTLTFTPEPASPQIVFRGSIRVTTMETRHRSTVHFKHVVLSRGDQGCTVAQVQIKPHKTETVGVSLIYPADCTPPQVLTVGTEP